MKHLMIPLLLFLTPAMSAAQTPESLQVVQNQDFLLSYTDIEELAADRVFKNAITLRLPANVSKSKLYCTVVFNGSANEQLAQRISIKPASTVLFPETSLSTQPRLLVELPANSAARDVVCDLIVQGQQKRTATGNYSFSLNFSTTLP